MGTEVARLRPEDSLFARQDDGFRWYRCLRCDSWLPMLAPEHPERQSPPDLHDIEVPLRGKALRDRYVLRLLAVDRFVRVLVLGALAVAVFAFAEHRSAIHHLYTRVLADLQGGLGGPVNDSRHGLLSDLNELFKLPATDLYLAGAVLSAYTVLLAVEMVGLWRARRWAEYLTLVETATLVPIEIYELAGTVSALKVLTLLLNLAVVAYLLWAHRLFGLRGGAPAERRLRESTAGWRAVRRSTIPPIRDAWLATAFDGGLLTELT